jgi:hypothetical protein
MLRNAGLVGLVLTLWCTTNSFGQNNAPEPQNSAKSQDSQSLETDVGATAVVSNGTGAARNSVGEPTPLTSSANQPKRILGIIPNYRSVSADVLLPSLSSKSKFRLATQDSIDYGSFLFAGLLAGIGQDRHVVTEFGQGAAGYGRYYWHGLTDEVVGNYFTEAIFPSITHEDPRYYTLGHGGKLWRTSYAISRLVVTKTDSGHSTFNFSEILGNGAGAAISNFYYPESERTWIKTRQKWTTQIAFDGVFNVVKEFWPDISAHLTKQH